MSQAIQSSKGLVGGGLVLQPTQKNRQCEHVSPYVFTLAAFKAGTVSQRIDANTGELTLGTGHGIETGDVVDIHWRIGTTNYCQRKVTVGTVIGNTVPIDAGVGDDLPVLTTAIVCCKQRSEKVTANSAGLQILGLLAKDLTGVAVEGVQLGFVTAGGTVAYHPLLSLDDLVQSDVAAGEANPLGGTDIATLTMTNGSASVAIDLQVLIGENV